MIKDISYTYAKDEWIIHDDSFSTFPHVKVHSSSSSLNPRIAALLLVYKSVNVTIDTVFRLYDAFFSTEDQRHSFFKYLQSAYPSLYKQYRDPMICRIKREDERKKKIREETRARVAAAWDNA